MTAAQRKIARWRADPVAFVREALGAEPDAWQADVLAAFPSQRRIAMKACKGPGKTTVLSWLAWNFLVTRPHPKIVATSISGDNLSDGAWCEMARWMQRSDLLKETFEWTKTRIFSKEYPESWFMSARTWPKSADPAQQADTLAGLHADYLLFILDEVGGIPDAVMVAAEAGLSTGKETKIVMAGNPTHLEGPLYRACTTERHLWFVVEITADPKDPKRTPRVSIEWANEQITKYGADSPWVLVNVFGRFPPSSINALLGPDDVSRAMERHYRDEEVLHSQKRLGVDVARYGDDMTVIFPRQGLIAYSPVMMRNASTTEIAARITAAKAKWDYELCFVDGTGGYGAGVVDQLITSGQSPIEVHFSGKPSDPRYFNKRSEIHFLVAEWVKRGGALPKLPELTQELTAMTYTFHNGKLRVEEKDSIKEKIGRSNDCFVAGTMITTPTGPVPIERIAVGDSVVTPMGIRTVIKNWVTTTDSLTTVKFSNGAVLRGKGSHEVFTWDHGWVRLDALSMTNAIETDSKWRVCAWRILNRLFISARSTGFKRTVDTISPTDSMRRRDFYIVGFGATLTGIYRLVTTFITKMGTGETTCSKIWNRWKRGSTSPSTCENALATRRKKKSSWPPGPRRLLLPFIGTKAKPESSGTGCTAKQRGPTEKPQEQSSASFAERKDQLISQAGHDSAEPPAPKSWGSRDIRPPPQNVRGVANGFRLIGTGNKSVVPVSVDVESAAQPVETYNLTLDRDNAYYANGVLVANCSDALALTFSLAEMPATMLNGIPVPNIGKMKSDYDPLQNRDG